MAVMEDSEGRKGSKLIASGIAGAMSLMLDKSILSITAY